MKIQAKVVVAVIKGWQTGTREFAVLECVNTLRVLPGDRTNSQELALMIEDGVNVTLKGSKR
jgi:hypothetical protein